MRLQGTVKWGPRAIARTKTRTVVRPPVAGGPLQRLKRKAVLGAACGRLPPPGRELSSNSSKQRGMAINPLVYHVVADRLSQDAECWQMYKPPKILQGLTGVAAVAG